MNWTCIEEMLILAKDPKYQDATLVCSNGNISVNSVILASMSPVIRDVLTRIPNNDTEEIITIICHDVDIVGMRQLFNSILNQLEEISLSKAVFDFLQELKIDVKKEVKIEDQFEGEALFSDYGNSEVNMNLDELINEHDPISELENEEKNFGKCESLKSPCKISVDPMNGNNTISCPKCGKIISRKNLARHLKGPFCHSNVFKCHICDYTTLRKIDFEKHVSKCESRKAKKEKRERDKEAPPKKHFCDMCSYVTTLRGTLNRHIRDVHYDRNGFKKCDQCKSLIVEAEFADHTCVLFKCETCGKEFGNLKYLQYHISSIHENKDLISCETCGKLIRKRQMHQHIVRNHLPDQKLPCHICGKELRTDHHLKKHLHGHSKEKELCTICNKRVANMKHHIMAMHTKEEDKKHHCKDCEKGFVNEYLLKTHQMSVHIKSRPYKCRYGCTFAYNDQSNRNAHERKIHGKKFNEHVEDAMTLLHNLK